MWELDSEEIQDVCCCPYFVRVVKSRTVPWTEYVKHGEQRIGGKRPFGRPRPLWHDNVMTVLAEMVWRRRAS
jgi:hypothetical protein